jgi:hypothetical protein
VLCSSPSRLVIFAIVCGVIVYVYHRTDPTASLSGATSRALELAQGGTDAVAPTTLVVSAAGFSHFRNLYLRNGTIFLLSPPGAPAYDPKTGGGGGLKDVFGLELLPIKEITSTGLASDQPWEVREATEQDIQVIPWEDRALLDLDIQKPFRVKGTTVSTPARSASSSTMSRVWSDFWLCIFCCVAVDQRSRFPLP